LPLFTATNYIGNRIVEKLWFEYHKRAARVSVRAEEILESYRTVKVMEAEMREYGTYKRSLFNAHGIHAKTSLRDREELENLSGKAL
jgi:ABC-type multidrug transport system fused ATPase/permease subunit